MSKNKKKNNNKTNNNTSKDREVKGQDNKFVQYKSGDDSNAGINRNSPEWYYPNPEIQKLAAAVNFNTRVGDKSTLSNGSDLVDSSEVVARFPGVAANPVFHTPGYADSPNDPVNETGRAMMNRIRANINANRAYEMPDLVKYYLPLCDFYAWIEFLNLIYNVTGKFNPLNKYTPSALLRAMHVDSSDVNNLRIQLEAYLRRMELRLTNLKLPTEIMATNAWVEDFKHIYVDEDIAKAQFILNIPLYILQYIIDPSTSKSKVTTKFFSTVFTFENPATVDDLIEFTEDLLFTFVNDEDFAIITGDVMKSYNSFYEYHFHADDLEFTYSKEFLEKWHNSAQYPGFQAGSVTTISDWEIVESTSDNLDPYLVFKPIGTVDTDANFNSEKRAAGNRFLDFYDREVTPDQIINGSLWLYSIDIIDTATRKYYFKPVGTSSVGMTEIVYFNNENVLVMEKFYGGMNVSSSGVNYVVSKVELRLNSLLLSKFNYRPLSIVTGLGAISGYVGVIGDFGNYTILDKRILEQISLCILYGQFNPKTLL